ncbi:MAG: hypothetical protein ABF649_03180 [Bacillus sp. (in: firmicutes)]
MADVLSLVLLAYEARRKALLDEKSALKRAESLGLQKGLQEGLLKGEQKGLEKGRQEAIRDLALSMIQKGIDSKTISDITGLKKEEINSLHSNN